MIKFLRNVLFLGSVEQIQERKRWNLKIGRRGDLREGGAEVPMKALF